jgi:predicted nucleotidyltransferase
MVLRPFCEKHRIRRLEVFGSTARGLATPGSDVDLLVTLDESRPSPAGGLLEMAGEAEELVGAPVDFVLRRSIERSPNRFARDDILVSAVCLYGSEPTRTTAGHPRRRAVVEHFLPCGRIVEPSSGNGAFFRAAPYTGPQALGSRSTKLRQERHIYSNAGPQTFLQAP